MPLLNKWQRSHYGSAQQKFLGVYPLALARYPPTRVPREGSSLGNISWETLYYKTIQGKRMGKAVVNECCWLLCIAGVRTEMLQALQEPGTEEGVYLVGASYEELQESESKILTSCKFSIALYLIKLNIMLVGTAKIFKGHRFIFTEQAKLLNLVLRVDNSITSRIT